MTSKIARTCGLAVVATLGLACTLWAQSIENAVIPTTKTLTITLKGTIEPILSGSDPLGLNGQSGKLTIMASESLSPTKHTSTSATYKLPAGAITVIAGSNKFTTTSPSRMIINLKSTADTMTLVVAGPEGLMVTDTTFLESGSWTSAVLKHPTVFKPSPQKVTSAKTSGGPGCKVKYTVFGTATVLGFHGSASSKAAVDPLLPDEESDQ